MPKLDVVLVTCDAFPDLDPDDRLLAAELRRRGMSVAAAVWNDPRVDWSAARLTLLRSTWDYHRRHGDFVAWLDRIAPLTVVRNEPSLLKWNAHKFYLRDLERAGIPVILPQTQEAFVPQMANLDLIGAVNFKKGCYPGQEIVARMQYLGKTKRRMYLAHVDSDVVPQAGNELFSMEAEGQACGMIANAQAAPDGGFDVLAVIQIASHDAFPVHLGALTGPRLHFQPLPYPLP